MQKIKSLADAGNPTFCCKKPNGLKLPNAENAHQEGHKFTPVITIWDLCNKAHLLLFEYWRISYISLTSLLIMSKLSRPFVTRGCSARV